MKYNIGDIVKLRDDLEVDKKYGGAKVGASLALAIGKKGEIKGILTGQYHIKFPSKHGGYHFVSDEMIEGLWEECKSSEQVSKSEDKLKLIDVLNMIAKGELKEGTKVKYLGDTYLYNRDTLVRGEDHHLLEDIYLNEIREECELIEPPCEHEWSKYSVGRLGRTENYRRCKKCGIHEEDIEPTDNTKIEELIADEINGKSYAEAISIIGGKLHEVINKVNTQTIVLLEQRKDIDEIKEQLDY